MINLAWYKRKILFSPEFEDAWCVRQNANQTLGISEMAKHMEQHNTPFSAGTIEGILTDFVKCIREQLLNGNTVKIDDLAIFKISVHSGLFGNIGDIDPKTAEVRAQAKVGSAVKDVKLIATATGDMTRQNLNKIVRFKLDTLSEYQIEEERKKILGNTRQPSEETTSEETPSEPTPSADEKK